MAVTIKDVSAKCGLSISTVSKAFNNYADISLETRELVQRTAREIGYYPNAIARTLKTNRSYNLGVLFQEKRGTGLTHSFFASVLDAFKSAGEKRGYDITFINHHIGWTGMTYLEHCRYRNVDGVCVVCADFYAPEVIELVDSNLPVVTIDHSFNNRSCVLSDNIGGLKLLVDAAYQKGHRKIAYVHGEKSSVTENRIIGFYRAMQEHGLNVNPDFVVEALYDNPATSMQAVLNLMNRPDPPTCILLPDDHSTLGALQAAKQLNLRVPEDLSLAGYDGIRLTQMLQPRLTTIEQDTKRIGAQAAEFLIDRIHDSHQFCRPFPCRRIVKQRSLTSGFARKQREHDAHLLVMKPCPENIPQPAGRGRNQRQRIVGRLDQRHGDCRMVLRRIVFETIGLQEDMNGG